MSSDLWAQLGHADSMLHRIFVEDCVICGGAKAVVFLVSLGLDDVALFHRVVLCCLKEKRQLYLYMFSASLVNPSG